MTRIKGTYRSLPGQNTDLSSDNISDERDWHEAFQKRMKKAGWTLKHEEVRNDADRRADFLAYHDDLNRSYESGEWIGFELKYSGQKRHTRASSIAKQIEDKYLDGSWLSSGEDVAMWVVAPYVEASHTGNPEEMNVARNRELEACDFLNRMGFGYLNSWHPTPHIYFDRFREPEPFPVFEDYIKTPAMPAFTGQFDPWRHAHYHDYEAEMVADVCRAYHSTSGAFTVDRDARGAARDRYGPTPDGAEQS